MIVDRTQVSPGDVSAFQDAAVEFARELPRSIANLEMETRTLIQSLPTLPTLATLAVQILLHNPDTYVEWQTDRIINEVEWTTRVALELSGPIPVDLESPVLDGERFQELDDKLRELYQLMRMYLATDHVRRGHEEPTAIDEIRTRSWGHLTAVRNLSYEYQRLELLQDLFLPLRSELRAAVGFGVDELLLVYHRLGQLIARRRAEFNARVLKSAGAARGLAQEQGASKEEAKSFGRGAAGAYWATFGFIDWIVAPSDLSLNSTTATAVLSTFALEFGQARSPRVGPVDDLARRPLVNLGEQSYFAHLFPLITEAAQSALEESLRDAGHWPKYDAHRARYLERRTVRLLQEAMPRATISQNLKYTDHDGAGELDVLVDLGGLIMFCECKAGTIKPSTRRGARLRRDLQAILGKAHAQAIRAREHAKSGGDFELQDGTVIRGASLDLTDNILVCVTLDDISSFATNTAATVSAGIFRDKEAPWAVSLHDLELIADIVELNIQLPHYIKRKHRIMAGANIVAMEEMDLFMNYALEGLYFATNLDESTSVQLLSFTEILDNYYMYEYGPRRKRAPKPRIRMKPEFRELIAQLERSGVSGWSAAALLLVDYDERGQRDVLKQIRELRKKTAPAGRTFSPERRDVAVILFGGPFPLGMVRSQLRSYATARMVDGGIERAVAIGVNSSFPTAAPQFIYLDAAKEIMPTKAAVARRLSAFRSRYLDRT